ncbi:hypothetical protein ACVBEQ_19690 [Nakamurella sp. GG22]
MRTSVKISLAIAGLVLVIVAAGGLLVWRSGLLSGPECTVPGDPAAPTASPAVEATAVQLQHASTINAVGLSRGIGERGRIIAVATAYQESTLRNLPDGDRDSVGLFQQRPSQGWGTIGEISDPIYAAGKFYEALVEVDGWQDLPLTQAAQAVQYSGFPDAYAKWEPQATTLVRALSGAQPLALTCHPRSEQPTAAGPERAAPPGIEGAQPALASVLAAANAEFGGISVQSVSPDGLTGTARLAGSELEPATAGRTLAAWAVAHTAGLGVSGVAVQDQRWSDDEWTAGPSLADPSQAEITVSP